MSYPYFTANSERAKEVLLDRCERIPAVRKSVSNIRTDMSIDQLLEAIPETNKKFYQTNGDAAFSSNKKSCLLFSETSGTSGTGPLLTPRGRDDLHWNTSNQAFAYRQWVTPQDDRVMLLNPSVMSPFIEGSSRALFDLGIPHLRAFPIPKICDWTRIVDLINRYEITAIMSTPSLILKFLYEVKLMGAKTPTLGKFLLTGEQLSQACLTAINEIFNVQNAAKVLVYGSSEAATVMYGDSQGSYRGYLSDFLFEVKPVNFSGRNSVESSLPNESVVGQLLITWLRDGIMPLVRYNTQDLFAVHMSDDDDSSPIFTALGRDIGCGLSPPDMETMEALLLGNNEFTTEPVYHFDIDIKSKDATVCLITTGESASNSKRKHAMEKIESLLQRRVRVEVNPSGHAFYDFSPLAKTNRVKVVLSDKKDPSLNEVA